MKTIAIVVFDEAQILDVAGPMEMFRGATISLRERRPQAPAAYETHIVARKAGAVRTSCGLTIVATDGFAKAPRAVDTLIVAGGVMDEALKDEALLRYVREAAAEAGGSFLTLPECRQKTAGGSARVSRHSCEAVVYGPADPKAFTAPEPQPLALEVDPQAAVAPGAPWYGSALQAWRIELDFWPAPGSARSAPRDLEGIREIDFPEVGQRRLADLSARCDEGCSVESVRRGLRAGAAWLGGTTLVAARCIQTDAAVQCQGSVSAPELEEGRLAGAR